MPIDDTERQRRRTLFHAHLAAENNFDLDRIMETFSRDTEMLYNKQPFHDHGSIRQAYSYMGFSGQGAFRTSGYYGTRALH